MRFFLRSAKALLLIILLTTFAGCGGGGTNTPPAISVSLAPSAQSTIDQGQTVSFIATIANDSASKGVTWSVSGTACSGDACGTLTNTTITGATYNAPASVTSNLTVSVKATSVSDTAKSATSTVVVTPPPSITITSLSDATAGTAYSATLQASGGAGTLHWSISSGTLPTGLSLNASTGAISGTPTGVGTSTFTVEVTDSGSPPVSAEQQLSVTVNPATLAITTTSLASGVVGTAYSATVQASGGTAPITWSVTAGALPDGLTLGSSGAISGTPTAAGTSDFTVTATDAATPTPQTASKQLSITINAAPAALTITTTSLAAGVVNTAYNVTLVATGGTAPYTWSVTTGALPDGLTLSGAGAISGTPTTAGTSTFTVTVTDSATPTPATADKQLSITIAASGGTSVTIGSLLRNIQPGQSVSLNASVQNDIGSQGVTWTLTASPNGTSCSPACGTLSNETTTSVTYTAPATLPSAPTNVPTITATSIADGTKTASDIFAITSFACGTGNEQALSGRYAFTLGGYNSDGYLGVGGSIAADGNGRFTDSYIVALGAVIGIGPGNGNLLDVNASTYSLGADNRGCATIWLPGNYYPTLPGAPLTLRFSLESDGSEGRIIEFDPPDSSAYIASGGIWKQDTSVFSGQNPINYVGNYAFGFDGVDSNGSRWGIAGAFSSNSSCSWTNGEVDINDAGATDHHTGLTGYCGGVSTTEGRFTPILQAVGSPSLYNNLIPECFLISGSEAACVTGSNNSDVQFTGMLRKQTGTFDNTSVNATAAFYLSGLSSSGPGSDVQFGTFTGDSSGTGTVIIHEDDAGVLSSDGTTCTYSVSSNGRTLLSGTNCTDAPILYLTDANTGFMLGMDSGVQMGKVQPQATGPFNEASANGTFVMGTHAAVSQNSRAEAGSVTLDGAGNVSGTSAGTTTTDQNANDSFTDTYTVNSDGTFMIGSSGTDVVGILISGDKLVLITDPTSTNPTLLLIKK